ncbi:MAG TPA: hypothetical protein PL063_02395 [Candidatus Cloacimonadota bacterium]|nr:hypothetical protein [Candidatus Cloacimonadota bacterium]HQB40578.1 hypothetical protein [Candidatus Cloacimonadota bacterium]
MKVYLSGDHKFPKRIGENILAYYANNNVVIMRKAVKRSLLPQNTNIKNNQPYLCALWNGMSLQVKTLFADYAKIYKIDTRQKRTQGVSAFSIFIYFIYRAERRFGISIKNMSIDFILGIFQKFNTLNKLMKESLLFCLRMKLPTRFRHLINKKQTIEDDEEDENIEGVHENDIKPEVVLGSGSAINKSYDLDPAIYLAPHG